VASSFTLSQEYQVVGSLQKKKKGKYCFQYKSGWGLAPPKGFGPALLAVFGGLLSSVMVILTLVLEEN
jgi:hypothetical protein